MRLSNRELKRLAAMQKSPLRYVERRIEEVELIDDRHYAVTVTQQFTVPLISNDKERERSSDKHLLIPLGWFVKDRLPDIQVTDADGSILPFLRRRDQGRIGAALFVGNWEQTFFAGLSPAIETTARQIWHTVQISVAQAVTSDRKAAQVVMYDLRQFLRERAISNETSPDIRCFILTILAHDEFWLSLKVLAEVRLLVTQMQGRPGHTYVVTIKYTERYPNPLPLPRAIHVHTRRYARRKLGFTIRRAARRFLGWLGVGSVGLVREAINLGQAASYWMIFTTPDGVEPVRCFWRSSRGRAHREHAISVVSTKAAVGQYHEQGEVVKPDVISLDVQVQSSSAIASAAGLAALLFFAGAWVYKAMPTLIATHNSDYGTILIGIATVLTATPSAIAGALAYRGHTFTRRISRGPRIMVTILAAQGAFLAIAVSLHGPDHFAEVFSFMLAIYSLVITGIFLFIRFGPRWRKNERTRRTLVTQVASPNKCRQQQAYYAVAFLIIWLLGVVVVARAQSVLQLEPIFGEHFPGNVWNAWWSWFG